MESSTVLTLNRKGTCTSKRTSKNQCKAVGHTKYKYKTKVKFHPKLDKDGFLIDHIHIHNAVVSVFEGKMTSCEKLSLQVAKKIESICVEHGCLLINIYVRIKPVAQGKDKVMAFMETEISY